ncbi:hypothetical protein ACFL1Y_00050 [Patescibacteria group bacterium]
MDFLKNLSTEAWIISIVVIFFIGWLFYRLRHNGPVSPHLEDLYAQSSVITEAETSKTNLIKIISLVVCIIIIGTSLIKSRLIYEMVDKGEIKVLPIIEQEETLTSKILVRFNDGGHANISYTVTVHFFTDSLTQQAKIKKAIREIAATMTTEESFAEKRHLLFQKSVKSLPGVTITNVDYSDAITGQILRKRILLQKVVKEKALKMRMEVEARRMMMETDTTLKESGAIQNNL